MRIDRNKIDFVLAEQCKSISELCPVLSASTLARIRKGCDISTKTAGKLARALNVPLERLIETKEG